MKSALFQSGVAVFENLVSSLFVLGCTVGRA